MEVIQTNIVTHTIDLNVSQPNNFEYVYTTQGDYGSDKIIANLYDQNVPYEIDCDLIVLQGVTPYGDLIEISKGLEISKDRHSVTFTLTKDMLSSAGDIQYTLSFIDTTGRCKKTTFPFTIKNTIEPSGAISSSTLTAITDYVLEAKQYAEDAKQSYDDLVSEKGKMNGIASLDENGIVPSDQLPKASTDSAGIVQLEDSVASTATDKAATGHAVKTVQDNLSDEIERAKSEEISISKDLSDEVERAKNAENLHKIDYDNPHRVSKDQVGLAHVEDTADVDKPVSTAQRTAIDEAYNNANKYTDKKIADLIDGAPETLDTLKEVADAIKESKDVEEALNNAIGTKANQTELDTHTGNDTIHITTTERTNWNDANDKKHEHVNKSVLDNITTALITAWNGAVDHIKDTVSHITSQERTLWNTVANKLDKTVFDNQIGNHTVNSDVPVDAKFTDTTYEEATKEHNGLMSTEDKTVIENFKSGGVTGVKGANETSYRSGNVSLSVDDIGAVAKEQIGDHTVKTNVPEDALFTDTTYDVVTETSNGLMSSTDKKNLEDLLDPYSRNMLADGTDFHEVTKQGNYQFHHTKTYINNPPMVNGFVDVKTYGNIVKQIAYRQGTIGTNDHEIYECTGNKATDNWSDWVRILTTKDEYTHPTYTSRTGVPTANQSPVHGGSFHISQPVSDETGHITAVNDRTITLPSVYIGGAAKASASYTLNASYAYLIIGTGHASSTSINSLSCGEYIYYANSKWNRTQIFASSFPAIGISGNTLIVTYNSSTGAYSCDRYILLRVK